MCQKCKFFSVFSLNYCPNCGTDLQNGKIKGNILKLNGHFYEYADEPILFDDWFIDLSQKQIERQLFHHSYSEAMWNRFDKSSLRKIVKTTNPILEKVKKFKND